MWKWWSENRGVSTGTRSDKHVAISVRVQTLSISLAGRCMLMASMVRAVGTLDLKGLAFVKADVSRKHSGFMHSRSQPQGASAWFIESNYWPSAGSPLQRLALRLCNWCRIHPGSDLGFPKNKKRTSNLKHIKSFLIEKKTRDLDKLKIVLFLLFVYFIFMYL